MNGFQNGKAHNLEKPFPGCLGRMVNLFDLSTGVAGNRLLTDKAHRDGSPNSRSQLDVAWRSPTGDKLEDKVIVPELRRTSSSGKPNVTPMKMLIAHEMSKEGASNRNPPNVVAKLMGLDALPQQQPDSAAQKMHSRGRSQSHSGIPLSYWQQEHVWLDPEIQHEIHQYPETKEYKDVYEIWQHSQKSSCKKDSSPQKGRYKETTKEKKMTLVRQKFIEAKRLATDEKLRQSKQFQEALEVLSSNKDLFLKLLQEPNSMFSQHFYDMQCIPPPPETKRITILRPSRNMDNSKFAGTGREIGKQVKKAVHVGQVNGLDKSSPGFSPSAARWKVDENATQPTRIVVLKPSPGKSRDIEAMVSRPSSSPRILHYEELCREPEVDEDETLESREMAKEITQQMRENLSGHQRDDALLSSVFSNGYNGDESSFDKSENEDEGESLSDSEVLSPASRHSWGYVNKLSCPFSSSSLSRVSDSPESSVCREAKKRLSERWAMMAYNGTCQEQRRVRRSSSTLGEMLALSDSKNSLGSEEGYSKQESRGSVSCLTSDLNKDESVDNSPRNLLRSKSVPLSSTVYGTTLDVEASDARVGKTDASNDLSKGRSMKSLLKGKVSSLFFSRNKKSSKEKPGASQPRNESQSAGMPVPSPRKIGDDGSQCLNDLQLEKYPSPDLLGSFSKESSAHLISVGSTEGIISPEIMTLFSLNPMLSHAGLPVTKTVVLGNPNENQDQPSPISVLEPPFEEDYHTASESSGNIKSDLHELELLVHPIDSNPTDKSGPIVSMTRTLSWDDFPVDTTTSHSSKTSLPSQDVEGEQEWFFFVQTLLSVAGLDGELQSNSFLARWHSPESPLDPYLRDKYVDLNDKEMLHEAKQRQMRSTQKLVFDCVNAVLVDISRYGSIPCSMVGSKFQDGSSSIMLDQVWAWILEWLRGEVRCVSGDGGDGNSLVVERVVRNEVVGKGWTEYLRLEMDNLGKEIEGKLLEELVEEALVELTGRVSRDFLPF